jgi:hypothetical protein
MPPRSINSFLDHVDVGDCVVTGELEAYSCAFCVVPLFVSRPLSLARARSHLPSPDLDPLTTTPSIPRHKKKTGKLAGLDKKLSRSLDAEVALGSSPLELSMSPVGPLAEPSR